MSKRSKPRTPPRPSVGAPRSASGRATTKAGGGAIKPGGAPAKTGAAIKTGGAAANTDRTAIKRGGAAIKTGSSYHHGDLRAALVDAAFASVDADGVDTLSLAGLAKSLGVSQPAPYRHFADRNAVLAAVATRAFREFAAELADAGKAGPPSTAVRRMARAYVDFGTRHAGIYRLMFASPILHDAASAELGDAAVASFDLLVNALPNRNGRERRAVRIWAALHGVVMLLNQGLLQNGPRAVPLPDLLDDILADR